MWSTRLGIRPALKLPSPGAGMASVFRIEKVLIVFHVMRAVFVTILVVATIPGTTDAQEWTRFRGPNGSGISDAKSIPSRWTKDDFNWKVAIPGSGHSSPVVWGNRLFLTSADEASGTCSLRCIDTQDGRTIWTHNFSKADYSKHQLNSRASATPALDANHVYVCWATDDELVAQAVSHQGDTVWTKSLGPYKAQHGIAASPIVHGGLLLIANDQDNESSALALEAGTGKTKWSVLRNTTANYSTPCLFNTGDDIFNVIFTSRDRGLTAIDVRSGKIDWELAAFKSHVSVASPIIADEYIVGASGGVGVPDEVVIVGFRDKQNLQAPTELHRLEVSTSFVPTPLSHRGMLFTVSDEGVALCVDLKTGKLYWKERLKNKFYSSPVCVDDKIYFTSRDGEVVVVEAAGEFNLLARNQVGDECHATPAVSGGRMYLRTFSSLISIGGRRATAKLSND
ncbi:MAG: hypothetical protein CMJ81_23220 [Planctomycetaceae bacterium]|nr:hypothetical protein [Planctomycetaceae bacterium]MBP61850.1 hypothetical protein [Planctomycetaceae bacterium]